VRWFDVRAGSGLIARDEGGEDVFFNFTAIPGGAPLQAGTPVKFELIEGKSGPTARNVQSCQAHMCMVMRGVKNPALRQSPVP